MRQKGFSLPIVLLSAVVLLTFTSLALYFSTTNMDSVQSKQEAERKLSNIDSSKSTETFTSPKPTQVPPKNSPNEVNLSKLPQAKSLDVDLKSAGFSAEVAKLAAEETKSLSTLNGPNNFSKEVGGDYYQQVFPKGTTNNTSNPRDKFFEQLRTLGWSEQILYNNSVLFTGGLVADGVCGGLWSMIGTYNGQLRFVSIRFTWNPCGKSTHFEGLPDGEIYKIFVSDLLDTDKLASEINSM